MKKKHSLIVIILTLGVVLSMGLISSQALAQEQEEEEVNTCQDFSA